MTDTPFPFSAIVGQEDMKRAMVLTAIDPGIGGVLVFGDRGTGKSTAVRALAGLLPPIRAVEGCPVNSPLPEMVPEWAAVLMSAPTNAQLSGVCAVPLQDLSGHVRPSDQQLVNYNDTTLMTYLNLNTNLTPNHITNSNSRLPIYSKCLDGI